jgi:hypothetical protein
MHRYLDFFRAEPDQAHRPQNPTFRQRDLRRPHSHHLAPRTHNLVLYQLSILHLHITTVAAVKMSSKDIDSQFQFLISCIKHSTNGKVSGIPSSTVVGVFCLATIPSTQ